MREAESAALRLIYIRARAMSVPTVCIVFNLCVYTTATAPATKIKEKIALVSLK